MAFAKKKRIVPNQNTARQQASCNDNKNRYKPKERSKDDAMKDKRIIEQLKSSINEKLKDKEIAKKAALIISELIKSSSK